MDYMLATPPFYIIYWDKTLLTDVHSCEYIYIYTRILSLYIYIFKTLTTYNGNKKNVPAREVILKILMVWYASTTLICI